MLHIHVTIAVEMSDTVSVELGEGDHCTVDSGNSAPNWILQNGTLQPHSAITGITHCMCAHGQCTTHTVCLQSVYNVHVERSIFDETPRNLRIIAVEIDHRPCSEL